MALLCKKNLDALKGGKKLVTRFRDVLVTLKGVEVWCGKCSFRFVNCLCFLLIIKIHPWTFNKKTCSEKVCINLDSVLYFSKIFFSYIRLHIRAKCKLICLRLHVITLLKVNIKACWPLVNLAK